MEKYGSVLLADMHQNMLEGIRGLMETMFSTVVMVADAESLYEAAEKINPDLVVVDLSMRSPNEINIVHCFRKKFPDSKLIILSVHDDKSIVDKIIGENRTMHITGLDELQSNRLRG